MKFYVLEQLRPYQFKHSILKNIDCHNHMVVRIPHFYFKVWIFCHSQHDERRFNKVEENLPEINQAVKNNNEKYSVKWSI